MGRRVVSREESVGKRQLRAGALWLLVVVDDIANAAVVCRCCWSGVFKYQSMSKECAFS